MADNWATYMATLDGSPKPNGQKPFSQRQQSRHYGTRVGLSHLVTPFRLDIRHLSWQRHAACQDTDPDIFFDDDAHPEAHALCQTCPVITDCLDFAMTHSLSGYWGGTTDRQRRAIRTAQARAARQATTA